MKKRSVNLTTSTYVKQALICLVFLFGFSQQGMTQTEQTVALESIDLQADESSEMSNYNISVEGSTAGLLHSTSINFERKLISSDSKKVHIYGRAGFGYIKSVGIFSPTTAASGGLLGLTMLTGKRNHHFEVHAGAFLGTLRERNNESRRSDETASKGYPLFDLGYRYQKPEGGFTFSAKVGTRGVGIGLGYSF